VEAVILDELLPEYDATRIEHRVIAGAREHVYDAVLRADFARALTDHTTVRLLIGVRTLAENAVAGLRPGRSRPDNEEPEVMRLADMKTHGQYVRLGEDPPHEVAFGMIGRFWGGETRWEEIDASDFSSFSRPGFARIGCNFTLRPYGAGRTLVSYETRTRATDDAARRAFLRYWRVVTPFVGVVLRAQLAVVDREAGGSNPGLPSTA
jgi:hypothetical protein